MFAASKSARSGATNDPNFSYVSLLLNGDGTNGKQNNTFLDSSTNNFTITRNGTPTQGSFSPYGDLWSNYFNGSTDYLSVADNAALQLTADFTIEMWAYVTSTASPQVFISKWSGSTGYLLYLDSVSNRLTFANNAVTIMATTTFPVNQWIHVAAVRNGNTYTLYANGVSVASGTSSTTVTDGGTVVNIGRNNQNSSNYMVGYISNLRIVKGTAVYTSNFTPSKTPLTAITNTSLLTCQSNRFKDNSSNNFTITRNGTPSVQRFSPFEPTTSYTPAVNGGSGYFGGSGNTISVADSASLELSSSDFCVEFWMYPLNTSGAIICAKRSLATQYGTFLLDSGAGGGVTKLYASTNGSSFAISGATVGTYVANQWNHIAVYRSGSNWYGAMNGVVSVLATTSITLHNNAEPWYLAGESDGYNVTAYFSDWRIVIGSSVYGASNFTPPTAPLTAITNTQLLTNFTNAGISDAAAINDLTTVGDAQVSTTVVKYGTASMKFDGTGDYLTLVDSPNLQLVAGDFTIEGWIYLAANGVAYGIISKGTSTTGWSVNVTSGNKLQFSYTSSNLTGATSLSATTWYHFAVVRSGTASGNLKVYLNGTADATSAGAVTDTFNQTSVTYIGADRVATSQLNGYIDDLRITNGLARYTASFTPPTAALPTF